MMKEKSKAGLWLGIAAVVVVIAIVVGVVVANSNKNNGNGENGGTETAQTTSLTMDDLANADDVVIVDINEFDKMKTTAKAIQNGEMTGKVVQIDGYVSHPGTKYSVVQENKEGTQKIGTEFVIVDADESEYPKDGARIFLAGKVVEKEPMYFVIETLKEAMNEL